MAGKSDKYKKRNKLHYDGFTLRIHKSKNFRDLITRATEAAQVSQNQFITDAIEKHAAEYGIFPQPLTREDYLGENAQQEDNGGDELNN